MATYKTIVLVLRAAETSVSTLVLLVPSNDSSSFSDKIFSFVGLKNPVTCKSDIIHPKE